MHLLLRFTRKTLILGLAGFGAYKAWESLSGRVPAVRERASSVGNRLVGVVQQAETEVRDASHDAAGSVVDASRIAVAEVAEAVADAAMGGSAQSVPASNA